MHAALYAGVKVVSPTRISLSGWLTRGGGLPTENDMNKEFLRGRRGLSFVQDAAKITTSELHMLLAGTMYTPPSLLRCTPEVSLIAPSHSTPQQAIGRHADNSIEVAVWVVRTLRQFSPQLNSATPFAPGRQTFATTSVGDLRRGSPTPAYISAHVFAQCVASNSKRASLPLKVLERGEF